MIATRWPFRGLAGFLFGIKKENADMASNKRNLFIKSATADNVSEVEQEDESVKAGRRNSKADSDRIQQMHDHTMALGALCADHNTPAPEVPSVARPTKPAKKSLKADVEGEEASDQAEALGLPLDKLVSAVRDAFYDLRTQMRIAQKPFGVSANDYWEWDDDSCPDCLCVYDGYAIARVALATFKVPYEVQNEGVVLAPQAEWEQVTQEWVTKSLPPGLIEQFDTMREVGAVKALGANRLGNYLIAWGDDKHRDLSGEFFTKDGTEGVKAIFDVIGKVPALYQHAMDGKVKYTPVGVIDVMEVDDVGLWTETQLDLANKYAQEVQKLARKKALGASSGTLPGARKVAANGEVKVWPVIEGSFTPTPMEPRLRELGVAEVKSIYQELGLEIPDAVKSSDDEGTEEVRPNRNDIEVEVERLKLLELSI